MKLHEKVTLVFGEDDQLTLHLSEPHFTLWQRVKRYGKLAYSHIKELF